MRRFFFEELSYKLALHTFNSQKYVYVYVPSRDLTLLEDRIEHLTSKRMLSRYQPICVRCKQMPHPPSFGMGHQSVYLVLML